jgi:hypothetical protein
MKKKREATDRGEGNVPPEAWGMGGARTVPIADQVDDRVSHRANGAAQVVLGRVQQCMAARKSWFRWPIEAK